MSFTQKSAAGESSHWPGLLGMCAVALCVIIAYRQNFKTPFIFDDIGAIVENPSIESFSTALVAPPPANGAVGRPIVNLSLAFNYALGGRNPLGYHLFNLTLHLLNCFLVFGLMRRTILAATLNRKWRTNATPAGLAVSLLWALHPLQTESVACVIQRTELLVSFFYLLTLYAAIRGTETLSQNQGSRAPRQWLGLALLSCFLGAASKEVIVTAPLIVFLYDRTFITGTFVESWRRRRWFYAGLASSWLLIAWLVLANSRRAGVAGFGLGLSPWHYLLTQCQAIVLYLRLALWPHPLVLDYGTAVVDGLANVWPQALLLVALAAATGWALWRKPIWGFLGAWFFVILSPSSSVVPLVTQTMAEHRMYLALLSLIVPLVLAAYHWLGSRAAWCFIAPVAVALFCATNSRIQDYRSAISIWTDAATHRPDNPRAHQNLGVALGAAGQTAEAMTQYKEALRLDPVYADAHFNLANALQQEGLGSEAAAEYRAALRGNPNLPDARYNLGNILAGEGHYPEAIDSYLAALKLQPDSASIHHNLGNALLVEHRPAEAVAEFETVLRLEPDSAVAHANLGLALAMLNRANEAEPQLRRALQLDPENVTARETLSRLQQIRGNP